MNKFMKQVTALVLTLALVMGVVVFPSYAAPEDIGAKGWVTVHKTNGEPDYSADGYPGPAVLQSSLKITKSDGVTPIDPQGDGSYKDIPAGAKIELTYAFSLADGIAPNFNEYEKDDYFEITLPDGITFDDPSGVVKAKIGDPEEYTLANWTISGSTLKFVLTDDAAKDANRTKWAKLTILGTFDTLGVSEDEEKTVVFGGETIVIKREPLPTQSTLAKEGSYDASTNEITWKVTITPPAADPTQSYKGYTILDEYSDNQEYVAGSFKVNATSIPDTSPDITVDTTNQKISYTFPDDINASPTKIEIEYKTKPIDFSGAKGESTFSNTANLKRGEDDAADPVTDDVKMDWLDKVGGVTKESTSNPDIVKWTITVKVPGEAGKVIDGAKIVDDLQKELKLLHDGSHPVQVKVGSAAAVNVVSGSGPGQFEYNTANDSDTTVSSQLIYRFPTAEPPKAGENVVLTFYTQAKDKNEFLKENTAVNFTNKASLQWDHSTDLTKSPSTEHTTTGSGTGTGGISGGGLLAKDATGHGEQYTYITKDVIKWTIEINRNEITMANAKIEDEVPSEQELLIDASHPLELRDKANALVGSAITVKGTNTSEYKYIAGTPEKFEYKLPASINSVYKLTYYTKITNWDPLYANGTIAYNNTVKLTTDGGTYEIDGKKNFASQMLAKTNPVTYDYDSHLLKWQLDINRNELPLTTAKITDTLPKGMVLEISTTHPFEVKEGGNTLETISVKADTATLSITPATATEGDKFEYTLGDQADKKKVTITFWAKLTDDELKTKWSGNKGFENEAQLDSDQKDGIKAKRNVNIQNPFVTKAHDYDNTADPKSDTINWTVNVNQSQVEIINGKVEDVLHSALQLVAGSVKLYHATISSGGTVTKGGAVTEGSAASTTEFSVDPPSSANTNTLTVSLPTPTSSAYVLEFATLILDDSINLTNEVKISGDGALPNNTTTSGAVIVDYLYSSGGSGSNALTVIKTKEDGTTPLPGATFKLLSAGKVPIKQGGNEIVKTTDANGHAVFTALPSWTFYVEETEPAPGYLIPSDPYAYGKKLETDDTVSVTNAKALAGVAFTKKGAKGELLSGGKFTLAGTNYAGTSITIADVAANASGIVSFANLELGTYTITETEAPAGHLLDSTPINVVVEYNATKTAVVVKLNGTVVTDASTEFINTPNTIDVKFTKQGVDENGNTIDLSGGKFTLAGTDYNGVSVTRANEPADANGIVTFTGIQIGTYTITETEAPAGYLLPAAPAKIFDVDVEYNTGKTGLVAGLTRSHDSAKTNIYVDTKGLADIAFSKVDSRDGVTPLSGGMFELSGTDYKGDPYVQTASSVSGTVTFTDVPIDNGSGYTIKELSPPPGFKLTTDTLTATVRYNAAKTDVDVTITPAAATMENDRAPSLKFARIVVNKTDTDGKGLAGAIFTLYSKGGTVIATAKSDSKGVADFGLIKEGEGYYIKETTPPKGYVADGKTETFDVKNSDTQTFTYINEKDPEGDPKEPEDDDILGEGDEKDPTKPGEDDDVLGEGDSKFPQTGDDFMPMVWIGSLIASLLGALYVLRRRYSYSKE